MENKIEVGDYIRTNWGHIGKLKRIELDKNDKGLKWYIFDHKEFEINIVKEEYINKPYITKHSKNIIDLIENKDIIKYFSNNLGCETTARVIYFCPQNEDYKWGLGYISTSLDEHIIIDDIKSIVTKEQFKQIEYIVKEEENE